MFLKNIFAYVHVCRRVTMQWRIVKCCRVLVCFAHYTRWTPVDVTAIEHGKLCRDDSGYRTSWDTVAHVYNHVHFSPIYQHTLTLSTIIDSSCT